MLSRLLAVILLCAFASFLCAGFPATFTDDTGKSIVLQRRPQRVVLLAPSLAEIVGMLNASSQVVAVSYFSDYPEYFLGYDKVSTWPAVDIEAIVKFHPDLVLYIPSLVPSKSRGFEEKLAKFGIKTFGVETTSLEDLFHDILLIGEVLGREKEANLLVDSLKKRVRSIREKVAKIPKDKRPKVFIEIWNKPIMSTNNSSFLGQLVEEAGGTNIFGDAKSAWLVVSSEEVIKRNPDIILVTYGGASISEIGSRPGWDGIKAVKEGKIFVIPPGLTNMFVRPGPRLVDALEILYLLLHHGR